MLLCAVGHGVATSGDILTGARDPRHEADRCNAEAYLAKPFDSQALLDVVRRFAT